MGFEALEILKDYVSWLASSVILLVSLFFKVP